MREVLHHHLRHFLTPSCPVRKEKARLYALPWAEFFCQLPAYLEWKKSIKVQPVGGVFVCSYYRAWNDWNVWVSYFDPSKS